MWLCFLFFMTCASCAHVPSCERVALDDVTLKRTAYVFLRDVFGMEYADEFSYCVRQSGSECGYLVVAEMEPNSLDADIFVFIGPDGVFKASGPSGVMFDARGDYLWGIPPSSPFPLVMDDDRNPSENAE